MTIQKYSSFFCFVILTLDICASQKDCSGVVCPVLQNCIETVLETGACCPKCMERGCICEGYQYYDCIQVGFQNGKVPEGESYFVDFGSTECSCPQGGGKISCRFIQCPEIPPNCIDVLQPADGCSECGRIGCTHGNKKYEAGHSFRADNCQVCHCPNEGGKIMCSPIPDCDLHSVDKSIGVTTTGNSSPFRDISGGHGTSQNSLVEPFSKLALGNTLPLYKQDPPRVGSEDHDYSREEPTSSTILNLAQLVESSTLPLSYPESNATLISHGGRRNEKKNLRTQLFGLHGNPRGKSCCFCCGPDTCTVISHVCLFSVRTAQQQCCLGSLTEAQCLAGINTARAGGTCREDCCGCCSLGLQFRKEGHACEAHHSLGYHCQHIFLTCCEGKEIKPTIRERPALDTTSVPRKVSDGLFPREAFSMGEDRDGENAVEGPIEVEDMDECLIYEGRICHHRCVNTPGSYRCECFPGYVLQEDAITCAQDVNECLSSNACLLNERCMNTQGSYVCQRLITCLPGQQINNDVCEDIDECAQRSHNCAVDSECVNTQGSFRCSPKARCAGGFIQDTQGNCVDIDECGTLTQTCNPRSSCINTVGSYICNRRIICSRGYHASPNGSRCVDVNECESSLHQCGEGQLCVNLPGSYRCECQAGYQYDSFRRMCTDVNECWRYPGRLCAQTCVNTPGSYECSCTSGFRLSGDSKNCEDVNECLANPCSQECANIYGSYQCYCRQGYYLREDGKTCDDIDECSRSIGPLCTYKCVNVPGSYRCACPEYGYTMSSNGRSCIDIDECAAGVHNCSLADTCYNIQGSYRCLSLSCPQNYRKVSDTRCERISCPNYLECQNSPLRITYYYLSFQSNIVIPAQIFRIGPSPAYSGDNVIVTITQGNEENYFSTRKLNAYTGAVFLQRQVQGPRDFLITVEMKLWRQGAFTTFQARIYVFITANSL
uniref:Fibulin 2 n=1 Tax=Oryzias sinensis TaxID=183150 RepID=A0A8C7V6G4_9TELE